MTDGDEAVPERKTFDLDAARAARDEKLAPAPVVKFLGDEYELPRELPSDAVHAFGEMANGNFTALDTGVRALFGDAWSQIHAKAKASGRPLSFEDEVFLLEHAIEHYGFDLPESFASGARS